MNVTIINVFNNESCPLIIQNKFLANLDYYLKIIFGYFSLLSIIFIIPGSIGSFLSLIVLYLKRNEKIYDGVIHYYSIIFTMDLILIIIYPMEGATTMGVNIVFNQNIFWKPNRILPIILCKIGRYTNIKIRVPTVYSIN